MNADDKKALRRQINEKKRALSSQQLEQASERLTAALVKTECWQAAQSIYIYLSYNNEVRTDALVRLALEQGKTVAVPLVEGAGEMSFRVIKSLDEVKEGYMGIREPDASAPLAKDTHALVILPGLAFDRSGGRMGYGGGYYDRFLEKEPEHPTAALCFDFQIVERVPAEEHDIPAGLVISAAV